MWRKKTQPSRRPHPDPGRELELLRILDLRDSIARRAELIRQYRKEIANLHRQAREDSNNKRIDQYLAEAKKLDDRITTTEASIPATHEQIAALQAAMTADDLAWLS